MRRADSGNNDDIITTHSTWFQTVGLSWLADPCETHLSELLFRTDNAVKTMIYFIACTGAITCVLSIVVLLTVRSDFYHLLPAEATKLGPHSSSLGTDLTSPSS